MELSKTNSRRAKRRNRKENIGQGFKNLISQRKNCDKFGTRTRIEESSSFNSLTKNDTISIKSPRWSLRRSETTFLRMSSLNLPSPPRRSLRKLNRKWLMMKIGQLKLRRQLYQSKRCLGIKSLLFNHIPISTASKTWITSLNIRFKMTMFKIKMANRMWMSPQIQSKKCWEVQKFLNQVKEIKVSLRKSQEANQKTKGKEKTKASRDSNQTLIIFLLITIYLKEVNVSQNPILKSNQNRRANPKTLFQVAHRLNLKIVLFKLWLVKHLRKQEVFKKSLRLNSYLTKIISRKRFKS